MKKLFAYYQGGTGTTENRYGYCLIHRVAAEGDLVGVEAMYEKGLKVQCPEGCVVGWYYDENGGFITAEQFEQIKKDKEKGNSGPIPPTIQESPSLTFNVRPQIGGSEF